MKKLTAIVCDQVRHEDNGKHILIGVYPDDILVADFPARIAVSIWCRFDLEGESQVPVELQIEEKSGKVALSSEGIIRQKDPPKPATITIPPTLFEVESETVLSFKIRKKKSGRWMVLTEMPITLRRD